MKAGDIKLFEELTPPAGGLDQLRARLDQEPARQLRNRSLAAASIAIATAAVILAILITPADQPRLYTDASTILAASPAAVRLGLTQAPTEPVSIAPQQRNHMAVQRVEVADKKVLYYRVTVLDEPS
jgi:hypothetical protein